MLPARNNLFPTMSNFFNDDWSSLFDWSNSNFAPAKTTLPSVNIQETGESFIVEMAAPGLKKEDFEISLNNNVLTIKSEFSEDSEHSENEVSYTRKEFSYSSFQRVFNLNDRVVDHNNISASYEDGILKVSLPKKEEAKEKPARLIEIS